MNTLDPAEIRIGWNRLLSIVDQGTVALKRTAFSRNVTDADDFSNALFDAGGNLIAQPSQGEAAFLGVMSTEVKAFLERYPPSTLRPGDVLLSNDPWLGASQLNDYTMVAPIFRRRRLVGFAACCAHSPDVGGRVLSSDSSDIHEEGFIIPPTFLFRAGRPNAELMRFIRANVRVPDIVMGDLMAQVASNNVVKKGVAEFLEDTGLPDLEGLGYEMRTRSERAMRTIIAGLPDGTWRGEIEADGDEEPVTIRVRVDVAGDTVSVDLAGTSPQSARGINVTFNWTYADVVYALLCALKPDSPINAGSLAPVRVSAPPGCILNAEYPAAVGARVLVAHYVQAAVFRALEPILPHRVIADSAAPTWVPVLSGVNRHGEPFVEILIVHGGIGARPNKDGMVVSYPDHPPTTAVEIFENEKPILVEAKELIPDSAGAGRYRGGPGQQFRFRLLGGAPLRVAMRADRIRHPPLGFSGGHAGQAGRATLNDREPLHPKRTVFIDPGDVVDLRTPGGGGYFDPRSRARSAVERDLDDGIVSPEQARAIYGCEPREDPSGGTINRAQGATTMQKEKIVTAGAPTRMDDHVHPFAQGWKVGDFVFTGGIAAEDPETGKMVEGDIRDQARRCMETMKAILEAAGSSLDKVVKVTVLFTNFDDKTRFEEVYGEYFPGDKPARTSAAVSYLGRNILMEIDAIAHV